MNGFTYAAQRGFAMGAKYGLVKGFRAYHSTEVTPELDESAMQGAIGIIIAVGGVLIALYIIAVVVGSISYSVTSGNIKLSPTWNTTITNIDSQAQATFNLANVLPIAIIGVGMKLMFSVIYFTTYFNDRDRCVQRPWYLSLALNNLKKDRTLNKFAIAAG